MRTNAFFPTDMLMDLGVLAILQLTFGSLRLPRLLAAEAILAGCTFAALRLGSPPAMHLPVLVICSAVATGARRPWRIAEGAVCMLCAYAAAAGFAALTGGMILPGALIGSGLLLLLFRRRRHGRYRWNIELYLEKDGLSASLPALIDTGNRLREHRSNLPVLIVEASAMPALARHARGMNPSQLRTLPFGVLGGAGEISCFRPDRVDFILPGEGYRPAPPCWVAVYPGRIPGAIRALAPPEFAEALR